MSALPGPLNAIAYAQFNIQGRWRRMLSITTGYSLVVGAGIWVTAIAIDQHNSLEGWVAILCGLQIFNLLIFGAFRVESAVRGDITSRMLESHRLMPFPPLGSILGYIFGSPLQSWLLALANFLLGIVCCVQSGRPLNAWAMTNAIMVCFAIFVYAIIAQFAFVARGGALLMLILGITVAALAGNEALGLLPPVAVLLNPLLSQSAVFSQLFGTTLLHPDIGFGYLIALAAQLCVTLIAIRVAVRRYLSSTVAGISARLGLMILAIWVAMSVVYFQWPKPFNYSFRSYRSEDWASQIVVSYATSILLALLPIGSAAWTALQAQRSADPGTKNMGTKKQPPVSSGLFTALAAAAIVGGLLLCIPSAFPHALTCGFWTMVIVANFLLSMAWLFSWGYLIRQRAWVFVFVWVMITWVVPIAADGIYRNFIDNTVTTATLLTAFSPPGALALIWSNSTISVIPGICGQVVLSMAPTGLLLLTQGRHRRKMRLALQAVPT